MQKKMAIRLHQHMQMAAQKLGPTLSLELIRESKPFKSFDPWVDNKGLVAAYRATAEGKRDLYLLLLDWARKGPTDYYLVALPAHNKRRPLAELHVVEACNSEFCFRWKYSPKSQDGNNEARRKRFLQLRASLEVTLFIPQSPAGISDFLEDVFLLAEQRRTADQLELTTEASEGFPEGKRFERIHIARERNAELVRAAKDAALIATNSLKCEVCGFDFKKTYGELGEGYIEAHHTSPMCELNDDSVTKIEDLALVCSNCHRMLHRRRPWISHTDLKSLLAA